MLSETHRAPVREGEILSGRYRIERILGAGGMGIVVAATHLQLEQRVAIKFLLPQALVHPEVVERFAREARAAVRIQSEHVAKVMDVGALADGLPFMVMEYLEGRDLAAVLRSRSPLPVDTAVDYLLQACEAIAEAHRLGIIHRDLKPSNLFLVEGPGVGAGVVKVLDFGISKVIGLGAEHAQGMTQSTSMLGSPLYMSPEQMDSARNVDGRTDIWALGAIVYEFLSGVPPFAGESIPQLCMAIAQKAPKPLRALRPDVPEPLQRIVLRCLEKERAKRFANVYELATALAPFAPARSHLSLERISALADRAAGAATMTSSAPIPSQFQPVETVGVDSNQAPYFGLGGTNHSLAEAARGSTHSAWGSTAGSGRGRSRRLVVATVAGIAVLGMVAVQLVRATLLAPGGVPAHSIRSEPSAPPALSVNPPAALSPAAATIPAALSSEAVEGSPIASSSGDVQRRLASPPHVTPASASPKRPARSATPRASEAWEDER